MRVSTWLPVAVRRAGLQVLQRGVQAGGERRFTIDQRRPGKLDAVALDPATVSDTLGVLLKYQDDIARLDQSKVKDLLDGVKSDLRAAE